MKRYLMVVQYMGRGKNQNPKVIMTDDKEILNHVVKQLDPSDWDYYIIDIEDEIFDADDVPMESIIEYIL